MQLTFPWEDVWFGMALSRVATGPDLAMVHLDKPLFADVKRTGVSTTMWVSPSTLVWHDLGERMGHGPPRKVPEVIRHVHRYALARHCNVPLLGLRCHEHRACSGAQWRRCKQRLDTTSNCSSELRHFNSTLYASSTHVRKRRGRAFVRNQ